MKCSQCNKHFTTPPSNMHCDKCQHKVCFESISEVFCFILDSYDLSVLSQENRIISIMRDLAPELGNEIRLVQVALESGVYNDIIAADQKTGETRELVLEKAVRILHSFFFLDEKQALRAINLLTNYLGWDDIFIPRDLEFEASSKGYQVSPNRNHPTQHQGNPINHCNACGKDYSAAYKRCPFCGDKYQPVDDDDNQVMGKQVPVKKKAGQFVATSLLVLLIVAISAAIAYWGVSGQSKMTIKKTYEQGINYYEQGEYAAAIKAFSAVTFDSKYFDDAQVRLDESKDAFRVETLRLAKFYVSEKNFDSALTVIADAQAVLPDDAALKTEFETVLSNYRLFAIGTAEEYLQSENFSYAVDYLAEIIRMFPGDSEIQDLYDTASTEFTESVLIEAKNLQASNEYPAALTVLDTAISKVGAKDSLSDALSLYKEEYKTILFDQAAEAMAASGHLAAIEILSPNDLYFVGDPEFSEALEYYQSFIPVDLQESQPNENAADSIIVRTNKNYIDSLEASSTVNWYKFDLNVRGTVTFNFKHKVIESATDYWTIQIYDASNYGGYEGDLEHLLTMTVAGNKTDEESSMLGLPAGTYYVKITCYEGRYDTYHSSDTYTIQISK